MLRTGMDGGARAGTEKMVSEGISNSNLASACSMLSDALSAGGCTLPFPGDGDRLPRVLDAAGEGDLCGGTLTLLRLRVAAGEGDVVLRTERLEEPGVSRLGIDCRTSGVPLPAVLLRRDDGPGLRVDMVDALRASVGVDGDPDETVTVPRLFGLVGTLAPTGGKLFIRFQEVGFVKQVHRLPLTGPCV